MDREYTEVKLVGYGRTQMGVNVMFSVGWCCRLEGQREGEEIRVRCDGMPASYKCNHTDILEQGTSEGSATR